MPLISPEEETGKSERFWRAAGYRCTYRPRIGREDARQAAREIARIKRCNFSMKLRKKVEMLFAHLKRVPGFGRLRLRDPCGANDEFMLAATAQNLRKLAKILPAPQQTSEAR